MKLSLAKIIKGIFGLVQSHTVIAFLKKTTTTTHTQNTQQKHHTIVLCPTIGSVCFTDNKFSTIGVYICSITYKSFYAFWYDYSSKTSGFAQE